MKQYVCFALFFFITFPCCAGRWFTYTGTLVKDRHFDGDSFYVKANTGYTYLFRLYGVDCPETDDRYPDRLAEQAAHFGIDVAAVIPWGERASLFTAAFLAREITVYTKKEKARGVSRQNRYYAILVVDGKRLDEALVENGYARAYGKSVAWPPDGPGDERAYMRQLRRLESQARFKKTGIWGAE